MTTAELDERAAQIAAATPELATGLARLRQSFPASQVGQLPRGGIQLDYVGHGAVTDRLLEVDPAWSWEPFAVDADGLPKLTVDANGNPIALWIRLTVLGVTRPGVGTCPPTQFDAEKVLIGDALRNAAMRFGVALDLWIRGHAEDDEKVSGNSDRPAPARSTAADPAANEVCSEEERAAIKARIGALPPPAVQALAERWGKPDPVTGDPTLWPLKVLPNRQVKAAHALVDSVEKQALTGTWGEWVRPAATDGVSTPLEQPEAASGAEDGGSGPETATGHTEAEPVEADLVCCGPGCTELATVITDQGEPWCAEHAPMTEEAG